MTLGVIQFFKNYHQYALQLGYLRLQNGAGV